MERRGSSQERTPTSNCPFLAWPFRAYPPMHGRGWAGGRTGHSHMGPKGRQACNPWTLLVLAGQQIVGCTTLELLTPHVGTAPLLSAMCGADCHWAQSISIRQMGIVDSRLCVRCCRFLPTARITDSFLGEFRCGCLGA